MKEETEAPGGLEHWKTMTEAELRDAEVPNMKSVEGFAAFAQVLLARGHDYGTAAYASSLVAFAAFRLACSALGLTGFQASCADLDFLRRSRRVELFAIVDYAELLYPQYLDKIPNAAQVLTKNAKWFRDKAREKLEAPQIEGLTVSSKVIAHWQWLAALPVEDELEAEGGAA